MSLETLAQINEFNNRLRTSGLRLCPLCRGCDQHKIECIANVNEKNAREAMKGREP